VNSVFITNSQTTVPLTPILRGVIRRAVNGALKYENCGFEAEISVTLTDNESIRALNSEYRGIDRETDVLSFPLFEGEFPETEDGGEAVKLPLGDIVISVEKAVAQAEEYGHSFHRELAFLCVHSVLHLLGYDHELSPDDEREMFRRQDEILSVCGFER